MKVAGISLDGPSPGRTGPPPRAAALRGFPPLRKAETGGVSPSIPGPGSKGNPVRLNPVLTFSGEALPMRRLIPLFLLAACGASPAPGFFGADRTEVSRGGRDYVVFRKGDRVEVIRLGHARNGEHAEIRATMIALIPEVTGCTLRDSTLQGDSGEMRGSLICG